MTEAAPRNLDVPPRPVRGPRGGARTGVGVLVGLIAVVAAAILVAQVDPAPTDLARISFALPSTAPSAVAATAGAADATAGPDASAILAATTPRMTRSALAVAVHDGTLDGRLVFVDGSLAVTPARCQSLAQGSGGCVDLAIPGLGLPVWQGEVAVPWRGDPAPGAWLVTVARTGGLVYLGTLVPARSGATTIRQLPIDGLPDRDGTLFEADGFLVLHPTHTCFRPGVEATPCPPPPPFLADDEPLPEGTLVSDAGEEVSLAPSVAEVDRADAVTAGTFLVLRLPGTEGSWQVVARYVPARAVRVLVP